MERTKDKNKQVEVKTNRISYDELASPGKFLIFLQFFCYVVHYVLKAVGAIFTARIIVGVYDGLATGDFSYAYFNLFWEFVFIFLRTLFTWWSYMLYNHCFNKSFMKVSSRLIKKLLHSKTSNFSETSNEQIQNIMLGDVDNISYFSDSFTQRLSKIIQGVVCLVIVARASWWVALILVCACAINYLILRNVNIKYSHSKERQYEARGGVYESVNRILESKEIINEFDANKDYEEKYLKSCKKYTDADRRRYTIDGFKNSWYYIYYMSVIGCLTAAMIYLVSRGSCDVELYLIVVPYFTTITETFNDIFEITKYLEDKNVSISRISTILNFTDDEINKFGNISIKRGGTNISFVGVTYKETRRNSPYYGELKDIDISFATNSINLIYGDKWCGKRLIFNMLRRRVAPQKGVILLDNINIYDYNQKAFNSNVYYTTATPEFIEGTIMENFTAICRNKRKIYKICKQLDIYDCIKKHPKGFNGEIDHTFTRAQKFLIGLARSLVTGCNTILIYEMPNSLTRRDRDKIGSILWQLSKKKTVVLFSHDDYFEQICKTIYHIKNGAIDDIKIHDNNSFCLLQQFDVPLGNNAQFLQEAKKEMRQEKLTNPKTLNETRNKSNSTKAKEKPLKGTKAKTQVKLEGTSKQTKTQRKATETSRTEKSKTKTNKTIKSAPEQAKTEKTKTSKAKTKRES